MTHRALPRVIIASGAPFFREGDRTWLPPIEWKSLKQWWSFLDDIVLLKPEVEADKATGGWLEVPSGIPVRRLCSAGAGRLARRRESLRCAHAVLKPSDVLMARMPYYETTWCYQIAKRKRIRVLLEIHGDWETAVLEEDASSFVRRATRRMRAVAARRAVSEMAASAIGVLGVGPRLLDRYVPKHVPALISTNHLLDHDFYEARADYALKNPPRILFVGHMQRRKGLHILFRSLDELNRKGRRFEMVMVGAGPMVRELKEYASTHAFADSVRFVGNIAHGEELYAHFRSSDVFVLPSIAAEGVPRVTHEAMAFGCPVIATDIGSVAWQLEGGAGIVVPPGDPHAIADAIALVLDQPEVRRSMSEKGFARSLQFTYERQQTAIAEFVGARLQKSIL